jgi:argininosuccinate synthase
MNKVVLAYSGGLDTSVALHWLCYTKGFEVVALIANLGQGKNLEAVGERAIQIGATAGIVADLRKTFVEDYVFPVLKANAMYESGYYLSAALGRATICVELVNIARQHRCPYVAHGCTAKGNDQVRFEASIAALAPDLEIIAPLREWPFKSREEEIDYAQSHNIPIKVTKASPYSIDYNLWGRSIECGVLEDPWQEPPEDVYIMTVSPEKAPDEPAVIEIGFEAGVPVTLEGKALDGVSLITRLNEIAGSHSIGRSDVIENRLIGFKSREIYEAPAAVILHLAHRALEEFTLSSGVLHFKAPLSTQYGDLVYNGRWFGILRPALDAFFAKTQEFVTGIVRLKLYKGAASVIGRKSPYSLYDRHLASYGPEDTFPHKAAPGFLSIWSLPLKTEAGRKKAAQSAKNQTPDNKGSKTQ